MKSLPFDLFVLFQKGNKNDNCGTGVGFTRNPTNGENIFFGEYLLNAHD
jgi:hypothetical protein